MHTELLDVIPLWAMFLAIAAVLWVSLDSGYRLGKWRRARISDEKEQPVGAMVASILGLVALVLGFTFSLTATRFEAKRMAVLDEANAIGTVYFRARLLPEPEQTEIVKLLRAYVDVRINGVQGGKPEEAIARSEALHELLWTQASAATAKASNPIIAGVFIQSLNEVINLHAKRVLVGIYSRIPVVLWAGLFGLSMLGMAAVGYQCGLSVSPRSPAMLAFVLAFTVVLYLIVDIDRGREGLLQVSQRSMVDLQKTMQLTKP